MTTITIVLICLGGVAACAALIFVVETLVAFGLHRKLPGEGELESQVRRPLVIPRGREVPKRAATERAA